MTEFYFRFPKYSFLRHFLQWRVRVFQAGSLPTGQSGVTERDSEPSLVLFVITGGILKFQI